MQVEETKEVSDQPINDSVEDTEPKVDSVELSPVEVELEKVKAKNRELLGEKKAAQAKLKEQQDRELEQQGKYKEMYESEKSARVNLQSSVVNAIKKAAVTDAFTDAGLNGDFKDPAWGMVDLSSFEVGDDLQVDPDVVKHEVKKIKEKYPVFFTARRAAPKDGTPTQDPVGTLDDYATAVKRCKTQKDLEAVRIKYGRT